MNREEIRKIVEEIFELDPDDIRDDADFHKDLGGDSIQKLELIVALEKRFDIHFTPSDELNMNCIDDVVKVTQKYAGE